MGILYEHAKHKRQEYDENDLICSVRDITTLFKNILGDESMPDPNEANDAEWERYIQKVNASIQERLIEFHRACLYNGIPRMYVFVSCDGKQLWLSLKMGIVSFPSDMIAGALFDWLKDFVLSTILSPNNHNGPIHIRIDYKSLTNLESRLIINMIRTLNEQLSEEHYIVDEKRLEENVIAFMDLDYMDGIGGINYFDLAERIHDRYEFCEIKAYNSGSHRDEWKEFMMNGIELVNVLEPPKGLKKYNSSYKLAIDATDAIRRSDRIVVVSGDRNIINLCFAVHKSARLIDFILPDQQTDINFTRMADNVLDLELNDYKMEMRA